MNQSLLLPSLYQHVHGAGSMLGAGKPSTRDMGHGNLGRRTDLVPPAFATQLHDILGDLGGTGRADRVAV